MDLYKDTILDLGLANLDKATDAGFGMYNFDIFIPRFMNDVLGTASILQMYPHSDMQFYGTMYLLVNGECYKWEDLNDEERQMVYSAFHASLDIESYVAKVTRKVVTDYGFIEFTNIFDLIDCVKIEFPCEHPTSMDLLYAICGIVTDICEELSRESDKTKVSTFNDRIVVEISKISE